MKKGLTLAVFVVSMAVGAVLGATTGSQETAAAPCCSSCGGTYNRCVSNCATDPDPANCMDICDADYQWCDTRCNRDC